MVSSPAVASVSSTRPVMDVGSAMRRLPCDLAELLGDRREQRFGLDRLRQVLVGAGANPVAIDCSSVLAVSMMIGMCL